MSTFSKAQQKFATSYSVEDCFWLVNHCDGFNDAFLSSKFDEASKLAKNGLEYLHRNPRMPYKDDE